MAIKQIELSNLENNVANVAKAPEGKVLEAKDEITHQVIETIKNNSAQKGLVEQFKANTKEGEILVTKEVKDLFNDLLKHLQKNRHEAQSNTGINFEKADVEFIDPNIRGFFNTLSGDIGINGFAVFTDKLKEILTHEGFHKKHALNNASGETLPLALEEGITQLATELSIGEWTDTYVEYKAIVLDMAQKLNIPYQKLCDLYIKGKAPELNTYWNKYVFLKENELQYMKDVDQLGLTFGISQENLWRAIHSPRENEVEDLVQKAVKEITDQHEFERQLGKLLESLHIQVEAVLEPQKVELEIILT